MLKQATVLAAALALAAPAAAQAGFTPPVHIIWQRTGTTPGGNFGWAVSGLGDVDRDGHADLLIGASGHVGGGIAYVYSGRTYRLLYTIPAPDATHAFGAGTGTTADVSGDRIPDEIVGGGGAGYVFSGADGHL